MPRAFFYLGFDVLLEESTLLTRAFSVAILALFVASPIILGCTSTTEANTAAKPAPLAPANGKEDTEAAAAAQDDVQPEGDMKRVKVEERFAACPIFFRERTLIGGDPTSRDEGVFQKTHTLIAGPDGAIATHARLQLDDDFINNILAITNKERCPRSQAAVLQLAKEMVPARSTFLVSEDSDTPEGDKFRLIFAHHTPSKPHLFMSAIAKPSTGRFTGPPEVVAFDHKKRAYNYYQLTSIVDRLTSADPDDFLSEEAEAQWVYMGDGFDYQPAVHPSKQSNECLTCHTQGGLNMKEIDFPWTHWHSFKDPNKVDPILAKVIAANAQASTADLQMMSELLRRVGGAQELENWIFQGQEIWSRSRISRALVGEANTNIDLSPFYAQVLCDLGEATLNSSSGPNGERFHSAEKPMKAADGNISSPQGFLFDGTLIDIGMQIRSPRVTIGGPFYQEIATTVLFQGFAANPKEGDFTVNRIADTKFPFFVPVPSTGDIRMRRELVNGRLLTNDLMRSVLMVDFAKPMFSNVRCGLLATFPKALPRPADNTGPSVETIKAEWMKNLQSPDLPADLRPAAERLLFTMAQSSADAQEELNTFGNACAARAASDPKAYAQDMMTIANQRRREFMDRYGNIVESNMLFPFDSDGLAARAAVGVGDAMDADPARHNHVQPGQFNLDPVTCVMIPAM